LNQVSSTYEKGLALELKLTELFRKMGYNVIHNAKKVGRSGVEHQIDILAEYKCPLHVSTLVVEAKSYESAIDKDRIMKLIQIVDDIGADRGIIVTTSYFTPEAIGTAKGYNIELWNREHLSKFLGEIEIGATEKGLSNTVSLQERVVKFVLSIENAKDIEAKTLEQRAKGGFLGVGKIIERLDSITLKYYPCYEAGIQTSVNEMEKTGLLSKRTIQKNVVVKVSINGLNGDIMTVDQNGLSCPYPFLKILNEDEVKAFKEMQTEWYTIHSLVGIGFSEGKAKKILNRLATVGAVEFRRGYKGILEYKPKVLFPKDPRILKSISDTLTMQEIASSVAEFTTPTIEASDVIKRIESYWNAKVNNMSVIYYPYYTCSLKTADGSQRIDMIDALHGRVEEV
jgi:Holliday junction resolvase